jgi:RNA polymerase sigma-70 factor (ECF subfamily)
MPLSALHRVHDVDRVLPGEVQDERVLVALALHDRQAFAPLYDHYVGPIYRYCYQRIGNREAAEDAASLVFVKALNALPTYRGGAFAGWLFAIAHNVVIDSLRTATSPQSLDAMLDVMDAAPGPEEEVLAVSDAATLRNLLQTLPEDQRRVLDLRLAGYRGAEIAAALGRSLTAVKTLQYRAMCQLRVAAAGSDKDHADG